AAEKITRAVGQPSGGLDLGEQIGELVPPYLKLEDGTSEGFALGPVTDCIGYREVGHRDRAHRGDQPLPLEVGHDVAEATVLLAEQVTDGDAAILERKLRRVGRVVAELVELARDTESLDVRRKSEERDAVCARAASTHGQRDEVGARAV